MSHDNNIITIRASVFMTVFFFSQASHEGTTAAGVAYELPAHVSATAAAAVVVRPPLIVLVSHFAVTH